MLTFYSIALAEALVESVVIDLLGVLVDLHRAVESFQLSHQQLQVGVDVAQLQQNHLFDLVVRCSPAQGRDLRKTEYEKLGLKKNWL